MIKFTRFLRIAAVSAAISCAFLISASAASIGVGTVNTSALRLRAAANTSSGILATASEGEGVVVLENAGNNWYKVDYKSITGYMSGEYLTIADQADVAIGYGKVNTDGASLNVRSAPSTSSARIGSLASGDVVEIIGVDHSWYKIKFSGKTGYVSSDYLVTVKDAPSSRGPAATTHTSSSVGSQIVSYAKQFLGAPYVWGGNGPSSFDCSGFTRYVYSHFGVTLNRTATAQLSNGTPVSKGQLQPGDLVFFRHNTSKPVSHVGIYIGGGQFIHASTNGHQVRIDSLNSGHYSRVYVYGRHIL